MHLPGTISLTAAAQRLRTSWKSAWSMVLRGELRGYQTPTGRWRVEVASVRRFEQTRKAS